MRELAESKGAEFRLIGDGKDLPEGKSVTVRLIKEGYQ
jgi:hypothetical protein